MSDDEYRHPREECGAVVAAALRLLMTEHDYELDEYEIRDALATAARAYARAIDRLPKGYRPAGWDLDETDALRVQVAEMTAERDWMRATIDRDSRVIRVWGDYHASVHPLPEDVRKKVLAAMDGTDVDEVRD